MSAPRSVSFDLIGVGSPIMDLLAHVDDAFLAREVAGAKGGMEMLDDTAMAALVARLPAPPALVPGGSAANTIFDATRLGLRTTFLGQLGCDDIAARYRSHLTANGTDAGRLKSSAHPNGRCLSLVTPDGQRTMRTCLGAAMHMGADDVSPADFAGCRHVHIEGYVLFNRALADRVVASARDAGCTVSLDLASFEVVRAAREWIFTQLRAGLHVIFANEDEARALFEKELPYDEAARQLASFGGIAAVKMGKDGAWLARGTEIHRIAPVPVDRVVDTTGAGDAWAAGFLAGHLQGRPLPVCGALGSLLGAETVRHLGAALPEAEWGRLLTVAKSL